jgi:hypothetical protein
MNNYVINAGAGFGLASFVNSANGEKTSMIWLAAISALTQIALRIIDGNKKKKYAKVTRAKRIATIKSE